MKPTLLSAALAATLGLSGCAAPAAPLASPPPEHSDSAPSGSTDPAVNSDGSEPAPPAAELTPQRLFQLLAAEMASQRGEIGAAWTTYMSLARETRDARLARRATELATNARALEQASQAAQTWSELAPTSPQAAQALELLRFATSDFSALEPVLSARFHEARQTGTLAAEYPRLQRQLLRSRDRAAAWALLQRVSAPDLGVAEARLARAEVAAAAEDYAATQAEALAALALKPDYEAAAILAARSAWRTPAQQAEALRGLHDFLSRVPDATEARYVYARMLLERAAWADARLELERLRTQTPDNPAVRFSLAQLAWRQQRPQEAEQHLKDLLALPRLGPRDDTPAFLFLAQIAEERGQPETALEWLSQVSAPEERAPATLRRAALLGKLGRLDEARDAVRDLIPRNPQEQALQTMTEAAILREAGQHQDALEVLEQGLKRQPDHPELLYDFSMAAERLDRLPEAERALRRLIELRPDHAHAFNALGYSLAERNLRLPEARGLIEQALRLAPDDAQIIDSMGWVLFRLHDYPGALMHLRRAYALLPDPEIAAHLAEVLWVSGQRDEARQVWRAALAKDPQNSVLRATVTRLDATP